MTRSAEMVWNQGKKPTKLGLKRLLRRLGWYSLGCVATIFGLGLLLISVVIVMVFNLLPSFKGASNKNHLP